MRISRTTHDGITMLHIHRDEAGLIETLVSQLMSLYQEYSPPSIELDPLLASLDIGGSSSLPDDPALARILPNAYEDDQKASEFRQVSEQGLINRKVLDAEAVLVSLGSARLDDRGFETQADALLHDDLPAYAGAADEETLDVPLDEEAFLSWTKTLTSMRLALAARLGIEREEDLDDEPLDEMEANTRAVYDWLAEFTEALLHARLN